MADHPITPPPELVQQWRAAASNVPATLSTDPGGRRDYIDFIAARAAQYGADKELEACCEWVGALEGNYGPWLRAARRPKPPSLAEEALAEFAEWERTLEIAPDSALRRALERLQELEGAE